MNSRSTPWELTFAIYFVWFAMAVIAVGVICLLIHEVRKDE